MADAPAPAATAARAITGAIVRHVITALGAMIVAHGYGDQSVVSDAVPAIAEQVLGVVIVCASAGWSALRARLSHSRWAGA